MNNIFEKVANLFWRITTYSSYRNHFSKCGDRLQIARGVLIDGCENISLGNNVYLGPQSIIYSTNAKLCIGDDFIGGPRLTIMTGDHRFDVVGKKIAQTIEKNDNNDIDVVIEDDVWCGANVTILKGVRIGRGSIIAAGATITKSVPSYSVYITPQNIKRRFTDEEIIEHEKKVYGEKR